MVPRSSELIGSEKNLLFFLSNWDDKKSATFLKEMSLKLVEDSCIGFLNTFTFFFYLKYSQCSVGMYKLQNQNFPSKN